MKTIYLEIENRIEKISREIKNEFLWYNPKSKILEKLSGGSISFVYDMEKEQLLPKVNNEKSIYYKSKSSQLKINDWIKEYSSVFDLEINKEESDSRCIAINIEDDLEEAVKYALDRYCIRYS